jgi:hypothetical protein
MRNFQVLLIGLLTVIACELGMVAVRLPASPAQAQTAPRYAPAPALQDPHDVIKTQLAQVQRALAEDRQRLIAMEQRMNDDSKRLYATCMWVSESTIYHIGKEMGAKAPRVPEDLCRARYYIDSGHFFANANFNIPFGP